MDNLMEARSWLGLDAFFDSLERSSTKDTQAESQTSISTDSYDDFIVDDSYMIIAQSNAFDDEMSDIADSVVDESTGAVSSTRHTCSVNSMQQQQPQNGRAAAAAQQEEDTTMNNELEAIAEEEEEEDQNQYEAYLRAKMFSLWNHIQQDLAHRDDEDLSDSPSTEEDTDLLKAFERKNATLSILANDTAITLAETWTTLASY